MDKRKTNHSMLIFISVIKKGKESTPGKKKTSLCPIRSWVHSNYQDTENKMHKYNFTDEVGRIFHAQRTEQCGQVQRSLILNFSLSLKMFIERENASIYMF